MSGLDQLPTIAEQDRGTHSVSVRLPLEDPTIIAIIVSVEDGMLRAKMVRDENVAATDALIVPSGAMAFVRSPAWGGTPRHLDHDDRSAIASAVERGDKALASDRIWRGLLADPEIAAGFERNSIRTQADFAAFMREWGR